MALPEPYVPVDGRGRNDSGNLYVEPEAFGRLAAQRQPFALMVNTNRHKDGRAVVLETSGIPVFDGAGHFRGYRGIDRDISHRVMTEERIRKLSRVVEQTANAVMITDMKGVIEYVNPKFREITGYAAHEVLGMNPRLLKSGEQPPEVYAEMWEALRTGAPWMGEFHNRRKDGSHFWCLQSVSAIRGESGEITHFVSVMEDIGSRMHAESTIRRLAYYDTLTGLPNRRLFLDRFGQGLCLTRVSPETDTSTIRFPIQVFHGRRNNPSSNEKRQLSRRETP